jgi:O-acetyl-ADP-ribose deacetylase (regulator of RNase III)
MIDYRSGDILTEEAEAIAFKIMFLEFTNSKCRKNKGFCDQKFQNIFLYVYIINTVNCVRVMGGGIAHQFKHAFPVNFEAYAVACKQEEVRYPWAVA